jgi:uroporphyrinogen decarboxylase
VDTPANRFLRACRRLPVDRTPVWFMRQAGRSLPEYCAIRQRHTLLEITRQPDLCAEVTLQPVRRLGVDAAILFSDIMQPLEAIGIDLELVESVGPVVAAPLRSAADVARLRPLEPEADLPFVARTIGLLRRELPAGVALIGFVGAPFTLAGYLVEGRPSREFVRTKQMMYSESELWHALMGRLADIVIAYGRAQIAAGAEALQVFDSWIGALSPRDYARFVQPHMRRIFASLGEPIPLADSSVGPVLTEGEERRGEGGTESAANDPAASSPVPLIHFGTGTATLLELMVEAGGNVLGLDWRVPLDEGWERAGGPERIAIQGNIDPVALTAPWDVVREEANEVLRRAGGRPGHIFNLGHGVLPMTPPETLERLVAFVHEQSSRLTTWAQEAPRL